MDLSRLPKRKCYATGKVIFVTRQDARSAMFKMKWASQTQHHRLAEEQHSSPRRRRRPKPRRVYYCEHCGAFHLTKREFPKPENRDEPKEPRLEPFIGVVRWFNTESGGGVVVLPGKKSLYINEGLFPQPYRPPQTGDILVGQHRDDPARGRDVAVYCRPASKYEDWRLLFGLLGTDDLVRFVDTDNRFASVRVAGQGANTFKLLELGALQLCHQYTDEKLMHLFFTYYKQELDPNLFIRYVAVIEKAVALTREPEDADRFLDELYGLFAEKMDSYLKLAWYQQQPLSVEVRRPNGTDPTFWFGDYEGILVREDTRYGDAIPYIEHALARLQAGINVEVAIERYNPKSQCLFIRLTERQASTLTEEGLNSYTTLRRRYEPPLEVPESMNVYTVIKTTRSLAIVELRKSCSKRKQRTFYEGIDVPMGPYAAAYRLYTAHTEPEAIVETFRDQYRKIPGLLVHVGEMGEPIRENVALQYQLILGGGFTRKLAKMIVNQYPDMEVVEDNECTTVRNGHYNILIGHADCLNFRNVDWPNHPSYATHRFIFVKLPAGDHIVQRPRIDIDHRVLTIGSNVVSIEPILAASFETLCEVMAEDAV